MAEIRREFRAGWLDDRGTWREFGSVPIRKARSLADADLRALVEDVANSVQAPHSPMTRALASGDVEVRGRTVTYSEWER